MKSIRRQLIFSLVLGVVALMAAAGSGLYYYVRHTLTASLDAALFADAQALAETVHIEDDRALHLEMPDPFAAKFSRERSEFYFEIWRADGQVFARSPSLGSADLQPPSSTHHKEFGNVTLPNGASGRAQLLHFVAEPDVDAPDAHGRPTTLTSDEDLTLVLACDRRSVDQPMRVLLTGLLLTAGLMTAGIIALVSLGVARGLRPLETIAGESERIGPNAMDLRFPVDSMPVELRPICVKLNELLERLHEAFLRERRFSADVAHELRTPIAELRSLAEVALRWPGDSQTVSHGFNEALAIAKQMESAVASLLSLVRCQAGVQTPQRQRTDLQPLVDSVWKPLEETARQRELAVHFDIAPSLHAETDPTMLAIILRNLFTNAVEYSPVSGAVKVEMSNGSGGLHIKVGNTNDSLDAADTPMLFQPFWRKDAARTSGMHTGLGLAIVHEYCKVLQIDIEAEVEPAYWFEVRLDMPAKSALR